MKLVVRAQIAYLEILRKQGLLSRAMKGILPPDVVKAVRTLAAQGCPGASYDKQSGQLLISAEDQAEVDRETEEYLIHYGLAVRKSNDGVVPILPRQILAGRRYKVVRGSYAGLETLVRGEDKKVYGIPWQQNFGHPACESFLFRIERDRLPLNGRVFVGTFGSKDALLHENEIGEPVA